MHVVVISWELLQLPAYCLALFCIYIVSFMQFYQRVRLLESVDKFLLQRFISMKSHFFVTDLAQSVTPRKLLMLGFAFLLQMDLRGPLSFYLMLTSFSCDCITRSSVCFSPKHLLTSTCVLHTLWNTTVKKAKAEASQHFSASDLCESFNNSQAERNL